MLSISYMKLFKKLKCSWTYILNLEEQFYQQLLSAGENYGTIQVIHARKGGTKMPSCLVIPSWLKKSPYAGQKLSCSSFYPSRFLYKQPLRYKISEYAVVTGLDCCHFYGKVLDILIYLIIWRKLFSQISPFLSN